MSKKLTKAQQQALENLVNTGFTEHINRFSRSQANKPLWRLAELGLATFEFGPKGSFLMTQGFMPTDAGRARLTSPAPKGET